MPGPVTGKDSGAISRIMGRQNRLDVREQYRKEAMLRWLRERESDKDVRPA